MVSKKEEENKEIARAFRKALHKEWEVIRNVVEAYFPPCEKKKKKSTS